MFLRSAHRYSAIAFSTLLTLTAGAVPVGQTAPNFQGTDSSGKSQTLSQYHGKYVVLEWHNRDCPYTKKHYASGNMQALQKKWTEKGVVWLTVISSAKGQQGYVTADEENAYVRSSHASPTAVILDPTGSIGHLYEAKTTPDMFVIDPLGKLIYSGAIDDHASTDSSDITASKNYVSEALEDAMAGKAIAQSSTRPYGCAVKYGE